MYNVNRIITTTFVLGSALSVSMAKPTQNLRRNKDVYSFNFKVDLFLSETGYFKVDGYDGYQPVLEMVRGKTYTFYQTDSTNWFHPLGFAYLPDGAHEGVDELEDGIGNGDAPLYLINNRTSELDIYEPEFQGPLANWISNLYSVQLSVTDPDVKEIFYFCHVHNKMSGRIIIVDSEGDSENYTPAIDLYEHDVIEQGSFDHQCGTFETENYGLDGLNTFCPDQDFLISDENDTFVNCMEAIDCKMNVEMSTEVYRNRPIETFMHQMIPHHSNAVNMAKILLKYLDGGLPGHSDPEQDDEVRDLMLEIINAQNAQITFMRGWLAENSDHKYEN
eukprot:Awhi_evm2s231